MSGMCLIEGFGRPYGAMNQGAETRDGEAPSLATVGRP